MALTAERYAELTELCRRFRIDVLTAIHAAQSGHPGGSLSVCEILTYLYQEHMNIDASKPDDPDRDRLVLSKGHAAPMLYRNLAEKGFFPVEEMMTLRRMGGLAGHPSMHTPGALRSPEARSVRASLPLRAWRWRSSSTDLLPRSMPFSATASWTRALSGKPQ